MDGGFIQVRPQNEKSLRASFSLSQALLQDEFAGGTFRFRSPRTRKATIHFVTGSVTHVRNASRRSRTAAASSLSLCASTETIKPKPIHSEGNTKEPHPLKTSQGCRTQRDLLLNWTAWRGAEETEGACLRAAIRGITASPIRR